jgi:hypothetical protein
VIRLTLAFAALLYSLPTAMAAFTPHTDVAGLSIDALPTAYKARLLDLDKIASDPPRRDTTKKQSFDITDGTEVRLDGRSCKFQNVPTTATIVSLELKADGKTVAKLYFKSKQMSETGR